MCHHSWTSWMGPVEIGNPPVTVITAGRTCSLCRQFQELAPPQDGADADVVVVLADPARDGRIVTAVD
jgi:hypothetical protein